MFDSHNKQYPDAENDYNRKGKIIDFIKGVGVNVAIIIVGYMVFIPVFSPFLNSFNFFWFIPLLFPVLFAALSFVNRQKYLGFGIIGGYIVLLLLATLAFGACMILIDSAYSG